MSPYLLGFWFKLRLKNLNWPGMPDRANPLALSATLLQNETFWRQHDNCTADDWFISPPL